MKDKGKDNNPKSAKYWFEIAENENEEIERKRQEFVRNVSRRQPGISADREKFPDGVKTGSYIVLPPNRED